MYTDKRRRGIVVVEVREAHVTAFERSLGVESISRSWSIPGVLSSSFSASWHVAFKIGLVGLLLD